jgi:hypothetical protein
MRHRTAPLLAPAAAAAVVAGARGARLVPLRAKVPNPGKVQR